MIDRLLFIILVLFGPVCYGGPINGFSESPLEKEERSNNYLPVFSSRLEPFDMEYVDEEYREVLLSLTIDNIADVKAKAKTENNAFYQYILGVLYEKGELVSENSEYATTWIEKAAKNGDREAQFRLATYYDFFLIKRSFFKRLLSFFGLRKEPYLSIYWYERAAEQNHPGAQAVLGEAYAGWRDGFGYKVEINFDKAKDFLNKSSQNGCGTATQNLRRLPAREKDYIRRIEGWINQHLRKKRLKRKEIQKIDEIVESCKNSGCTVALDQNLLDKIEEKRREWN